MVDRTIVRKAMQNETVDCDSVALCDGLARLEPGVRGAPGAGGSGTGFVAWSIGRIARRGRGAPGDARDGRVRGGVEMTRARLKAVGFCAWMNEVGDRAFRFALDLARRHHAQLDVFIFPCFPCVPHAPRGRSGELFEMSEEDAIEAEKEVRLYYDDLLGDYVDVGYRLCLGDESPELRRCLFDREYDILVLPYEERGGRFGERTVEEFAHRMQCPVVLVGADGEDEVHVNSPARLWLAELGLDGRPWRPLPMPAGAPARSS
jgi:hypothetical protein